MAVLSPVNTSANVMRVTFVGISGDASYWMSRLELMGSSIRCGERAGLEDPYCLSGVQALFVSALTPQEFGDLGACAAQAIGAGDGLGGGRQQ